MEETETFVIIKIRISFIDSFPCFSLLLEGEGTSVSSSSNISNIGKILTEPHRLNSGT